LIPFWGVYNDKSLWFGREAISKVSVEFGCSRDWKKWNSISECWSDEFQGKTKSTQVGHSCLTQRCDQDSWQYVGHVKHRGRFTYPLSLGLTRWFQDVFCQSSPNINDSWQWIFISLVMKWRTRKNEKLGVNYIIMLIIEFLNEIFVWGLN
jgi:hypothetical protein